MMVSTGITILAQTATFNGDIQWWRRQYTNLKTLDGFNKFLHQANREQRRAVTTTGKVYYTAAVTNVHHVLTPPPEDHHEVINALNIIYQGIHAHS